MVTPLPLVSATDERLVNGRNNTEARDGPPGPGMEHLEMAIESAVSALQLALDRDDRAKPNPRSAEPTAQRELTDMSASGTERKSSRSSLNNQHRNSRVRQHLIRHTAKHHCG